MEKLHFASDYQEGALPEILRRFQECHPGITIRIDDNIRRYVVESLASGKAHI